MPENSLFCRPEVDIPLLTSFISCLVTRPGICPPTLVNLPQGVVIREGSMFDFHGETFLVVRFYNTVDEAYCEILYTNNEDRRGVGLTFDTGKVLRLVSLKRGR